MERKIHDFMGEVDPYQFMPKQPPYVCYGVLPLRKKQFVATGLFLGAASIGAAPTVACSGSSTIAAPKNGTVGAAGNTSHLYKCVDL